METHKRDWNVTQTERRFKRHENYVSDIKLPTCALVETVPYNQRCQYVLDNSFCNDETKTINYIKFYYCTLEPTNEWQEILSIGVLILLCGYLFAILSTLTDKFFCPPLKMISKAMNISENVAGVTILAFGNSASDMLLSFSNMASEEADSGFSDSLGAATFLSCFVTGVIITTRPFHVQPGLFIRDISFLILLIMFIDYAMESERVVTVKESIAIICIYICYILVVIIDQCLLLRTTRNDHRIEESKESPSYSPRDKSNRLLWRKLVKQFFKSINPIDPQEWKESGYIFKMLIILKVPVVFILLLFLPIVDDELENNGWTKLLNSLQIVLLPLILCGTHMITIFSYEIPISLFILVITLPIFVITILTTSIDKTPSHHLLFAVFAIIGSIDVLYVFATEVKHILEVIGIVTSRSKSFLGCTLLAWGNSIGDCIADISMAKQGYPNMGFSACLGGPLFYIALGLGATFLYKSMENKDHTFAAPLGSMGENCTIFLLINLSGLLFAMSLTNFNARRSIGIYMITCYILFFFYTILGEYEIVHTFGSDHREDRGVDAL